MVRSLAGRRFGLEIGYRRALVTSGCEVEQDRHQLSTRNTVDGGVVHLGVHRDPPAHQPGDEVHLPQGPLSSGRACSRLTCSRRVARPSPVGSEISCERGTRCRNSRHRSNTVDPGRVARFNRCLSSGISGARRSSAWSGPPPSGGDSLDRGCTDRRCGRWSCGSRASRRPRPDRRAASSIVLGNGGVHESRAGPGGDNPIGRNACWPAEIHPANGTVEVAEAAGTSRGHASCGRVICFLVCSSRNERNCQLWSTAWPPRRISVSPWNQRADVETERDDGGDRIALWCQTPTWAAPYSSSVLRQGAVSAMSWDTGQAETIAEG